MLTRLWGRRRAAAPSALARRLADGARPLGGLGLTSAELADLIGAETDPAALREAIRRADRTGDDRWRIAARERLQAVAPDPVMLATLVELLCNTRQDRRAAALLPDLERQRPPGDTVAQLQVRVAAVCGDWDRATAALEGVHPGAVAHLANDIAVMQLLQGAAAGALDRAREVLAGRPDFPVAAVTAVRAALFAHGPAEGRAEQAAWRLALRPGTAAAAEAELLILMHCGRHREASEVLAAAMAAHPRAYRLLWLATGLMFSEAANDRISKALQTAAAGPERIADLLMARIVSLASRAELDPLPATLEALRCHSDWAWLTARVHVAAQTDDVEGTLHLLSEARAAGVWHGGPEMNALPFLAVRAPDHPGTEQVARWHGELARWEQANPGYWTQRLRWNIARGDREGARRACAGLSPGLRAASEIAPMVAHLENDPDDIAARCADWGRFLARSLPIAIAAGTAPPAPVAVTWDGRGGDVLLFAVVQNGMEFLPWLVDYYRALGVDHLFIVDNGSSDGSADWLRRRAEAQRDLSLFAQPGSFRQAAHGVAWTNHLMQRYGVGHWCFHVDMDEAFVFPGMDEGRRLSDLLAWLDAQGAESVPGFMLDIYPERLDLPAGTDSFAASTLIDDDYTAIATEFPPHLFYLGGVRARMAGQTLLMTKAPLVRMRRDLFYFANNHFHTPARLSGLSAVLLHYKFVGDLRSRVDEQVTRGEHFMGGRFYRSWQTQLHRDPVLRDDHSIPYEGPRQLVAMGYMQAPQSWLDWPVRASETRAESGISLADP